MKAVILAGGFGTRLRDVVSDVPKPMAPIVGKPFLEHQIRSLKKQGIEDIILAVHYNANIIKSYFGNGLRWSVNITYSEEDSPLGTAGAIKKAEKYIDDTFFVLNGDSYSKMDLKDFLEFHKSKENTATISLIKKLDNSSSYGNVILDKHKIVGFSEKNHNTGEFINAGVYLFEPRIFDFIEANKKISLEEEVFPELIKRKDLGGYPHSKYFIDIGNPETYSQFKKDFLKSITLKSTNTIREAIQKINENKFNLISVIDGQDKFKGVLTEKIIMESLIGEERIDIDEPIEKIYVSPEEMEKEGCSEKVIKEKLAKGVNHLPIINNQGKIVDVRFRSEEIKEEHFPEVSGKAPLRISFAGGGTDKEDFFEEYGGSTISSTIDKYCHATIIKRADSKIIIRSDLEKESILDSKNLIYDGKHSLIKAVTNIMEPNFGFEIYARNDVTPGRGLGSSASFSVLVAKLIGELQEKKYNDYDLAKIAYDAERKELKIHGGWQDQHAAIMGGFNFMEFDKTNNIINPLRLKRDIVNALNDRLVLCYVGQEHNSGKIHEDQEKILKENKKQTVKRLKKMKNIAMETKNSLLFGDIDRIGELLHESWELKRNVGNTISNSKIDNLYQIGKNNGAYGGKALGAGGGGYILFYVPIKKRYSLIRTLENEGGEIMNFNFEDKGTQIWRN